MELVPSHLAFVKEQVDFHTGMIAKHEGNERRQKRHIETKKQFEELAEYLANLEAGATGCKTPKQASRISLSWDEVEGLPEELLAELSVSDADRAEFQILSIMERVGGLISLDRLLVELFKETGEVTKRAAATNRMYRMVTKGLVQSVPGKKGVYSLTPVSEEEASKLV